MKILFNTPQLSYKGGVGGYYLSLKKYWTEDVKYTVSGSRRLTNKLKLSGVFFLPFDIIKLLIVILLWKPDVIVFNPSFIQRSLIREIILLNFAKQFNKKICIFIRGWNASYEKKVNKERLCYQLNKSNLIIVLSNQFKLKLKKWGVDVPIKTATTKVDDSLLKYFHHRESSRDKHKILFLATIKREKGIYEALEVIRMFNTSHYNVELNIGGTGPLFEDAMKFAKKNNIKNVNFLGHINGKKLADTFLDNDIFFFPTFHGEGMPNSVLEAMAFGLPVVTRPVGGIKDFFENEKMGYLAQSTTPNEYFKLIESLLIDPERINKIGEYNHIYAKNNFLASLVAANLEKMLGDIPSVSR